MTTLSSGYDSSAASVLGAAAGIREAFTVEARPGPFPDDGAPLAAVLGLRVQELPFDEWREDPERPEIECAASCGGPVRLALTGLTSRSPASLVLVGTWGDDLWTMGPQEIGADLCFPARFPGAGIHPSESTHELGVRAGIVFVHVGTIGGVHAGAIHRISHSEEMRPWSVGRKYDRPIPRRMVEDAGVARADFGQHKVVGASVGPDTALSTRGEEEFGRFWASLVRELGLWQGTRLRVWAACTPPVYWVVYRIVWRLNRLDRRIRLRQWEFQRAPRAAYRFHWAVGHLALRYAEVLDRAATDVDRPAV